MQVLESMSVANNKVSRVFTTTYSNGRLQEIEIQVLLRSGLSRFDIIGLPQNIIREGKDRILSSLSSVGLELPNNKILVSLNPADLPKEGSHFDLPILVGILQCMGVFGPDEPSKDFYWGELKLDGSLRNFPEVLAHALYAENHKADHLIVPHRFRTSSEDTFNSLLKTPTQRLRHVSELFQENSWEISTDALLPFENKEILARWVATTPQDNQFERLHKSKEDLELWGCLAVGKLNALFEGPPGTGKSSWCHTYREFQLPILHHQWRERFLYQPQASQKCLQLETICEAPFQAPHHHSSVAAIVGGGSGQIVSGAISRAHLGTLFLDEFNEFPRNVVEALREPLETKKITIARRGLEETFKADVQVLAAMNPCACGYYRSKRFCTCTPHQFSRFQNKISGPIRDRFHFNLWWDKKESPATKIKLQEFRKRILEAFLHPDPRVDADFIPKFQNFRLEKKWIESLKTYARWHKVSKITLDTVDHYKQFREQWEKGDEERKPDTVNRGSRARA